MFNIILEFSLFSFDWTNHFTLKSLSHFDSDFILDNLVMLKLELSHIITAMHFLSFVFIYQVVPVVMITHSFNIILSNPYFQNLFS
jgi:hypothetical protein